VQTVVNSNKLTDLVIAWMMTGGKDSNDIQTCSDRTDSQCWDELGEEMPCVQVSVGCHMRRVDNT
jgi:hypothetical protein